MPSTVVHMLLPLIVAISILLMVLRPYGIPEVYWVSAGAVLLLVFRLIPLRLAGYAIGDGSDVYLFLIGMMLLSELARAHSVFDWLASLAVRCACGSCSRLFALVYGIGIVTTIFLSNDATAIILTPAILGVARKAKVAPLPYLIACAMIANAASFVLPISNPANLVVFDRSMPSLGRWLTFFTVPSIASIVVTYVVLRLLFHKELRSTIDHSVEVVELPRTGRLVLAGLACVVAVLLAASALNWSLGLPTCLGALALGAVAAIAARINPVMQLKRVSWSTLVLVAGLFILVEAVESRGALKLTQSALNYVDLLPHAAGGLLTGFVVAIADNLVNNLPLGLIAGNTLRAAHHDGLLAKAVLIAVDLGPNLSVSGSLATILWMIALRKEKIDVSFRQFLKIGVVAMPLALLATLAAALVMPWFASWV